MFCHFILNCHTWIPSLNSYVFIRHFQSSLYLNRHHYYHPHSQEQSDTDIWTRDSQSARAYSPSYVDKGLLPGIGADLGLIGGRPLYVMFRSLCEGGWGRGPVHGMNTYGVDEPRDAMLWGFTAMLIYVDIPWEELFKCLLRKEQSQCLVAESNLCWGRSFRSWISITQRDTNRLGGEKRTMSHKELVTND